MTLSNNQIRAICRFTYERGVHYYDLQIELVDHLASSIENQTSNDPDISFFEALEIASSRFGGIRGFKRMVRERKTILLQQKRKLWLQAMMQYFTTSKLVITLLILIVSYFGSSHLPENKRGLAVLILLSIYSVVEITPNYFFKKNSKRKLIFSEPYRGSMLSGILFPHLIFIAAANYFKGPLSIAILATVIMIVDNSMIVVNQRFREEAKKLYPQAFINA